MPQQQSAMARIALDGFPIGLPNQGQDALNRCYECQSRLVAMVAHDLKSPLNVLVGIGEALQRSVRAKGAVLDQAEILEELDTMLVMGADMTRLIDKLLASARIESGTLALEFSVVDDLAGLLRAVVEVFQAEATRRDISLHVDLAAPLPRVHWDICAIQYHVLNNILSNALQYTGSRGTVELRCRVEGGRVMIEIADNGPGIPNEAREKVFDRFERLGLKDSRVYQGSGLGLYNAHLVARQHGGAISIEDGIGGRGAAFTVSLPIRPSLAKGC